MIRAGAVLAAALIVGGLALIAVVMGVFVPMHAPGPPTPSCGHLLDPASRHGSRPAGCKAALRDRRIEVAAAAVVGGAGGVVALIAGVTAMSSRD